MSPSELLTHELVATAQGWAKEDPDDRTRRELLDLLASARSGDDEAAAELLDAFDGTLQFGTAGLRGRLGPGSNRMNRVVVCRAAAGLADYLVQHGGTSVVIGFDARYNSDVFARDTAEIMAGAGIRAHLLPRHLPTPVLAFAIHHLKASAGVMVTASHNPPEDNGYKVYLGDGRQIVPPADSDISACIAQVGDVRFIPRSERYQVLDDSVLDAYVDRVISLPAAGGPRAVSSIYTAMHGVGGELMLRAVRAAGFPEPQPVPEQYEPDPDFPTVPFPNPEEPGAMDLSLALAAQVDADVIIANDPDADRCSVGIPSGDGYRMLTGDEVGALLGWWIARRQQDSGAVSGVMAESIVSGTLLREIAQAAGLEYATTLTGFKWISRVPGLVFGYEEALGYCVDPQYVSDKDGVSASLLVLEMAAALKAEGRTLQDALDDLAREHGVHVTTQLSMRVQDISLIAAAMRRLRGDPPTRLGGRHVQRLVDLNEGDGGLPPTDGLEFTMDGARVIVRPSGTEPKLKCYLQVVVPVDGDLEAAKLAAWDGEGALRKDIAAALGL